jgi:hypothetical protein
MGYRMTIQMKQTPEPASAMLIKLDLVGPPVAPLAMPKQVLTPEPGQIRRALGQIQSWLGLGRNGLRRAG